MVEQSRSFLGLELIDLFSQIGKPSFLKYSRRGFLDFARVIFLFSLIVEPFLVVEGILCLRICG
jgi:hypothetical protein